jgi:hypothetical protein
MDIVHCRKRGQTLRDSESGAQDIMFKVRTGEQQFVLGAVDNCQGIIVNDSLRTEESALPAA